MKAKEFADDFNFNEFDKKKFIEKFTNDFNEAIVFQKKQGWGFSRFKNCVKEASDKFSAIFKAAGTPPRDGLWGFFYATVVVKMRAEMFPREHADIEARRKLR